MGNKVKCLVSPEVCYELYCEIVMWVLHLIFSLEYSWECDSKLYPKLYGVQ